MCICYETSLHSIFDALLHNVLNLVYVCDIKDSQNVCEVCFVLLQLRHETIKTMESNNEYKDCEHLAYI